MPWVDTNVIVRYLLDEQSDQAESATRLFRRAGAGQVTLTVDDIIVAEAVWTLRSYYRMSRSDIAEALSEFVSADGIDCRDGAVVLRALVLFRERNVDFADALLCARMLDEGDVEVYSFDRDFDRIDGVRRLEPG